jgi:hypothetical protein
MDSNPTQPISTQAVDKKLSWKTVSKIEPFLGEKPFLGSFWGAFLLFASILLLFRPYFQWNDDYYAVLILKGIGLNWAPSELNILENPLLGLALKNLFLQFPTIEWFSCFFVLAHFLSTWALLAAFNLGAHRFFKTFLFILGSVVLEVRFVVNMQYTAVAATTAIGAFLLLAALWKKDESKYLQPAFCLICALVLISVLIRPYSLGLIVLAAIPAGIYLAWKAKMTSCRWRLLGLIAVTALLSFAVIAFRHYDYSQHPEWKDYDAITDQYVQLSQFRNPVYDENTKPVFDSIGWSANDLKLFRYNYFMDTDTYSVEKLQKLNSFFPHFGFNKSTQDTFGTMFANPGFLAGFLFFLAMLPFIPLENFWFIAADAAWTILIFCFCQWYLKMPERIFLPCLYWLNCLTLLFAVPKKQGSPENPTKPSRALKWGTAFQILCFLFTAYLLLLHYVKVHYWTTQEVKLKSSLAYLNPQDDQVFVTWGDAFPYTKIGAFDNDEFLRHFHTIAIDWFQRSPITIAMMDHYGLKNLLKDMVNNPKVFLICHPDELNLYQVYMKEKYNRNVIFYNVFNSDQFMVFAVRSS